MVQSPQTIPQIREGLKMTIDVAASIARILKQEGVERVSTFPVCRANNAPDHAQSAIRGTYGCRKAACV